MLQHTRQVIEEHPIKAQTYSVSMDEYDTIQIGHNTPSCESIIVRAPSLQSMKFSANISLPERLLIVPNICTRPHHMKSYISIDMNYVFLCQSF
jgi:hypothetical protein